MNKTLSTAIGLALLLGAVPAFAQTASSTINANIQARITNAKSFADQEITRRTTALTDLNSKVSAMVRVSASTKSAIATTVQTEIANLTALNAKIQADTDTATLKTDIASIATDYRIFKLVIPQGRIEVAADKIMTTTPYFTTFAGKLQTRISQAQTAGNDVSALTASLADMNAKVADANTQAQAAVSLVANLQPDGGNQAVADSNKAALQSAAADIKAALADLQVARQDAGSIARALQGMGSSGSASGPTVSNTVNGASNVTLHVGDMLNEVWSSTGAVSASSNYTQDSSSCGTNGTGPFDLGATPTSGSSSELVKDCWAGHTYIITVTVVDSQGRKASASATVTVAPLQPSANAPVGWLDQADCTQIGGWAQDADAPTQPLMLSIYSDGALLKSLSSNGYRQDLCSAIGSCNQAFAYPTPASLMDDIAHRIQLYAADNSSGALTELLGSPKTLQCGGIVHPNTSPGSTASFTVNGGSSATVKVRDIVNYAWSSTGAVSAKTTYTVTSPCGAGVDGPYDGNTNTLSGTFAEAAVAGCATGNTITTFTYTVTDAQGKTKSATATLTITPAQASSAPTASLTYNGSTNITLNVGDTLNYAWSATGDIVSTSDTYTQDSSSCGVSGTGPFTLPVSPPSGTASEVVKDCWAGHTYTETFTVTDSQGRTASASATVTVPAPVNVNAPIGYFDNIDTPATATGWALDKDASSQSINVAVYMDGPKGQGQLVATVPTNIYRADVNSGLSVTGNHGFEWQIPAQYASANHSWYVYGIDSANSNSATILTNSPKSYPASDPYAQYKTTNFGIIYELWQCDGYGGPNTYDILHGSGTWGAPTVFHWWDTPAVGYYCYGQTSNWSDIVRKHAEMLRDAGVNFVVLDITNWPRMDKFDAQVAIIQPLQALLPIWNSVPNAPKIAQWTPLTSDGDMFAWVQQQLDQYPNLAYNYQGKPLEIITANPDYPTDAGKYAQYAQNYTLRSMWALSGYTPGYTADEWSFVEPCQSTPCNQRTAQGEQIPVSPAYSISYINNPQHAVPKNHGQTYVSQFTTVFNNPSIPIVITSAWNEWISQRICVDAPNNTPDPFCTGPSATDHWPNGNKIFTDDYDYEYSRDIEPSLHAPYDYYYQLMKDCILKFRQGQLCSATDIPYVAPPPPTTASAANQNLANALTALESALRAIQKLLGL